MTIHRICPSIKFYYLFVSVWIVINIGQSLLVKVSKSSTKKVSSHAFEFASLTFEPITSMHGLCHGKKSEQAGCIASAQIQMPPKELPASLRLHSANSMTFSKDISFLNKLIVEYLHMQWSYRSHSQAQQYQPLPNPSVAYQTNHLTSSCPFTFQLVVALPSQHISSIPVQTCRVTHLDLIASLLLNQILRELNRTIFLWTQFIIVIIVIGHLRRCHRCHCHVRSLR